MERWKINLYTIWSSQIICQMSLSFGIPFLPFYIQELGVVDPEQIKVYTGILSMAPALTNATMAPIWGMIADKWGKKPMLLRAMLSMGIILAMLGMVTNVNYLVGLRVIQGIFSGTIAAATALVVSGAPTHRLSYVLGVMTSSTFIGHSLGPVIGGFLAEYVGYRNSFFIGSGLLLLDFILVMIIVKEPESAKRKPEVEKKGETSRLAFLLSVTILAMLFLQFILKITRSVFSPYMPLYIQEMWAKDGGAAKITGLINGATALMTALSGLIVGHFGDYANKVRLLKLLFISGIIISATLPFISNMWIFGITYAVLFLFLGGAEPIAVSITAENTPSEKQGTLFGIQALITGTGRVVAPVMSGAVALSYSLHDILYLIPTILATGIITIFITGKRISDINIQNEESKLSETNLST
jgi:DHA1 family multidrug resistance protein-like MFS transporter